MCDGVQYHDHKIYFPQLDAKLPVKLRGGGITWVTWGRCQKEAIGKFPNGFWVRLDSIKMGKWKPWHPKPVLIRIESFLEKDHGIQSHWITLAPNMFLQGLVTERNGEQRVYVVTEETT